MSRHYQQQRSRKGSRNRGQQYRDAASSRWRPFPDEDTRRDWPSGDRGWPERDYQDDTSEWESGRQSGGGYGGPASYEYRDGRGNRGFGDERAWSNREFADEGNWQDYRGSYGNRDNEYGDSYRGFGRGGQWRENEGSRGPRMWSDEGGYRYGGPGQYGQGQFGQGQYGQGQYGQGQYGQGQYGQGQFGQGQYGQGQVGQGQYGQGQYGQSNWGSDQGRSWSPSSSQSRDSWQWSSQAGPGQWSGSGPQDRSWSQSSSRRSNGPKGYERSDERLKDDICERLMRSSVDCSDVSVQVQSGKVSLEGTVPDRGTKYQIEDLVDNSIGVKDIDNRLRIQQENDSASAGSRKTGSTSGTTSSASSTGMAGSSYGASSSGTVGRQRERDS